LAIVTLLALGIEPSAQQILEIATRRDTLRNVTVEMPFATKYASSTMSRLDAVQNEQGSSFYLDEESV
jgi:hypothetical protein